MEEIKSLYYNTNRRDELISILRQRLNLSLLNISDDELIKITKNTFFFNKVELYMALKQFWKELKFQEYMSRLFILLRDLLIWKK